MNINLRFNALAVLALAALGLAAWLYFAKLSSPVEQKINTGAVSAEVPVVMRTPGGVLEVAIVKAYERFTRTDSKEFWGVPLGTTISQIQVPVFYRYHIELAREWTMNIRGGKTCIVRTPPMKVAVPVAYDSSLMEKYSANGWARFNKHENLELLERSITPLLGPRGENPLYMRLAKDVARVTVKEFVTKWLLKEQQWATGGDYKVIVLFPGETEASLVAATPAIPAAHAPAR